MDQILKAFIHLARELQVYLFSGALILTNVYLLDQLYCCGYWRYFNKDFFWAILVIFAYVLGHLCMALYYVLLEMTKLDKWINRLIKCEFDLQESLEPALLQKDKELYQYFIERGTILTLMRWTMSAAFFIVGMTDVVVMIFGSYKRVVLFITIFSFIAAALLYILAAVVEKEHCQRIVQLKSLHGIVS